MITVLKRLWKHGSGTVSKDTLSLVTTLGRGKPILNPQLCDGCGDCVKECPTEAISLVSEDNISILGLAYAACISCTICSSVCHTGAFTVSKDLLPPVTNLEELNQQYRIKKSSNHNGGIHLGELAETVTRSN